MPYNNNKLYKILEYLSRYMLNFGFSEKVLRLVSPPHFAHDFSSKMFVMLLSINWPDFIVLSSLLFEILGNMCIKIASYPDCDVIKFEINLIFLIKPFRSMTKKTRQKLKYLENEKRIWGKIIFKELSVAKNCLKPESAPLTQNFYFHASLRCLKRFLKAFQAFIKPFEAPQRNTKIKNFS